MSYRDSSAKHRSEIRFCRRLRESSRFRDEVGLFVLSGQRHFMKAYQAGFDWLRVYVCFRLLKNIELQQYVGRLEAGGVDVRRLGPEEYRAFGFEERASGVAAVVKQRWVLPDGIDFSRHRLWLAVGQIRNAGNLGTLLRSARAFGCDGVLLTEESPSPYSPEILRASMGGVYGLQFARVSTSWLSRFHASGAASIIGATPHAEGRMEELNVEKPVVVFVGEERSGLTPEQLAVCHQFAKIEMEEGTDSLNLGVAGSLFLHEIYRKRRLR